MYRPKGWKTAFKIVDREIQKGVYAKFLVYYDPDIDGLIAGYVVQRFLRRYNIPSEYYINENREHGFKMTEADIERYKGYTIIAVDFTMTQEDIKYVISKGINVISIDHHNIVTPFIHETDVETTCEGVIINNQYDFEPQEYKFLSGAGVVHCVLEGFLETLGLPIPDVDEQALVGITLLSDVRATEGAIAQSFLKETFHSRTPQMRYLVDLVTKEDGYEKYESFGLPCMSRNFVDYTFSPHFNALFRMNRGEDAIRLVNGDVALRAEFKATNRIFVYRDMQNAITERIMQGIQGDEGSSLIVKGVPEDLEIHTNHKISNFIGLACSRVRGDYKTTFLYVEDKTRPNYIQRGSVRGLYDDIDYLGLFRQAGLRAEGHKNAFGVLATDLSAVDIVGLNKKIQEAEYESKLRAKETRRVLEVSNLTLFLKGPNKKIAQLNTYVRGQYRVYLKYTGSDIEEYQRGKMREYTIDGITVKCFDLDLTVQTGLILPIYGKGDYMEFTLRKDLD